MRSLSHVPGPVPPATASAIPVRPRSGESSPVSADRIRKLIIGPTGLGTSGAWIPRQSDRKAEEPEPESGKGVTVPPLYCPDAVRDNPALGAEVNDRLVEWAEEIGIYEGRLDKLHSHQFGRLIMLAHPETDDAERLLIAAKCALSEWSVDDHWVDEGDNAPELIGPRLALAHAIVDPVRLPPRYLAQFEDVVRQEPVLRAFRSCLDSLATIASWTQVARLRHELAVMFVAYGQEAEWRASERTPAVWEYLLHRYENAFFPCMVLVDPVAGYELPAHEFANPRVRRTYLIAGTASVLLNDLYSMGKEDPADTNLPNLMVAEDGCTVQEAVNRTAELHNEMMHAYEAEAAVLGATGSPQLKRYLAGVWSWMGGCKEWHATSPRYQVTQA